MKNLQCEILENKKVTDGVFKMTLAAGYIAKNAQPGQFVHVRCQDTTEPLLRRPLSVHRVSGGTRDEGRGTMDEGRGTMDEGRGTMDEKKTNIELLYKVVGKGTRILSEKKPGETLDVLGPLGRGFDLRGTKDEGRRTILVAGGMGVAPLFFLAQRLAEQKSKITVIIGARTKKELHYISDFKKLALEVHIATDDGSEGYKGLVTDFLKNNFSSIVHHPSSIVYACGPRAMLKQIAAIAKNKKIACQASLENWLGCGIGACLGCAIKVKSKSEEGKSFEYKRVCKDGPVFDAQEIIWK